MKVVAPSSQPESLQESGLARGVWPRNESDGAKAMPLLRLAAVTTTKTTK